MLSFPRFPDESRGRITSSAGVEGFCSRAVPFPSLWPGSPLVLSRGGSGSLIFLPLEFGGCSRSEDQYVLRCGRGCCVWPQVAVLYSGSSFFPFPFPSSGLAVVPGSRSSRRWFPLLRPAEFRTWGIMGTLCAVVRPLVPLSPCCGGVACALFSSAMPFHSGDGGNAFAPGVCVRGEFWLVWRGEWVWNGCGL